MFTLTQLLIDLWSVVVTVIALWILIVSVEILVGCAYLRYKDGPDWYKKMMKDK